jgi:CelD/BcsL family acetyltransferase involved in cellulose biosynthesis
MQSRCELTLDILETTEELLDVRTKWDAFIEGSGSDIYFTTDWLVTWWKYYSRDLLLRCFFIRCGGRVVAAIPFCIQSLRLGPIKVRIAKLVGSDYVTSVFTPAVESAHALNVWNLVVDHLLKNDNCDLISISSISGASSAADSLREMVQKFDHQLVRDDSPRPHTLFMLPKTVDEYCSTLSGNTRWRNRRNWRRLSERVDSKVIELQGDEALKAFDDFVALHQAQWHATKKQGHFVDWPDSFEFNRDVIQRLAAKGQVRLHGVVGNGQLLAAQYSFVLGDRCYWRLPARCMDPLCESVGLGRLALVKMIESLISEGVRVIEAGPGHYGYKIQHGGAEFELRRLVLSNPSSTARIKAKLVLLWSDVVNVLYYRVWFLKVSRYFHMRARGLSKIWLETRL